MRNERRETLERNDDDEEEEDYITKIYKFFFLGVTLFVSSTAITQKIQLEKKENSHAQVFSQRREREKSKGVFR